MQLTLLGTLVALSAGLCVTAAPSAALFEYHPSNDGSSVILPRDTPDQSFVIETARRSRSLDPRSAPIEETDTTLNNWRPNFWKRSKSKPGQMTIEKVNGEKDDILKKLEALQADTKQKLADHDEEARQIISASKTLGQQFRDEGITPDQYRREGDQLDERAVQNGRSSINIKTQHEKVRVQLSQRAKALGPHVKDHPILGENGTIHTPDYPEYALEA